MSLIVAISRVSDGSMLNRENTLDPQVIENRKVFLKKHDIEIAQTTRVCVTYQRDDFLRFTLLDEAFKNHGMTDDTIPVADALITNQPGEALFLAIADCVGAVLYDPLQNTLAVVHLGRHSLEQQGGKKIVEYLTENFSTHPSLIKVWLTPAPGKDVYPIWKLDNKGMKEAVLEQLKEAGIVDENITDNTADTDKDSDYFSYSEFLKGNRENDGDYAIVAMMTN